VAIVDDQLPFERHLRSIQVKAFTALADSFEQAAR
jgi:hypothetical protein